MFLKISFKNKTKKVKFLPLYKDIKEMNKLIKDITGLPSENVEFFFFDVENEKISLQDSHDIEYFMD